MRKDAAGVGSTDIFNVGVDHVGVVGTDLDHLVEAFTDAGFVIAPRGELLAVEGLDGVEELRPIGQFNQHLIFGAGYVELTAFDRSNSDHHLSGLADVDGMHIVCVRSHDIDRDRAALSGSGIAVSEPGVAARSVRYPDREGTARFRWAHPDGEAMAYACVVEHLTPELVLHPLPTPHPNGAIALVEVTLANDEPSSAVGFWRQMNASLVGTGCTLRISTAGQLRERFPQLDLPPKPAAITLTTMSASGLVPPAAVVGGVIVEFVPATVDTDQPAMWPEK